MVTSSTPSSPAQVHSPFASASEALRASITSLSGVGDKLTERLARLNILTVGDLLLHLPSRYQDRTRVVPIAALSHKTQGVCEGEVVDCQVSFGRRRSLLVTLSDGNDYLKLRYFYFGKSQQSRFAIGKWFRCYGEMRWHNGEAAMVHPETQAIAHAGAPFEYETTLTPIYPLTEKLTQAALRKLTKQALQRVTEQDYPDLLQLLGADFWQLIQLPNGLPTLYQAIYHIHYPAPEHKAAMTAFSHPAQHRLIFEELLAQQLALLKLREETRRLSALSIPGDGSLTNALLMSLPFSPTQAQRRVSDEIYADLSNTQPMQRLVQGDVGAGKTLVAALAILRVVESGQQAVLMAPTEILAEQHTQTLSQWFEPLGVKLDWLTGKRKGKSRTALLEHVANGEVDVLVGTHAVFQASVEFDRLALVVIDEQHRFGVGQRFSLRNKGVNEQRFPHQLILTATPIPRTLAMTMYADLDVSIIDELPPGRTPIQTVAITNQRRDEIIDRVRQVCLDGGQVYWVCSLIEPSEEIDAQDAQSLHQQLSAALPEVNIGLVHGKLSTADKDAAMQAFKNNDTQVLVATTVIEVGVDVPNASIMVIENAERFGLSQLHQLRGRVGRGAIASYCLLVYESPLGDVAKSRLDTLRNSTDGFEIAREDLALRGAGEVLGTRQTGEQGMRIANLDRDAELLPCVQKAAEILLREHPKIAEQLIQRWLAYQLEYGAV